MQPIPGYVNERSTRTVKVPFLDQDGAPLSDGIVVTLRAWVRDRDSDTLIRDGENVLNANGGTFANGELVLALSQADTAQIGAASLQRRLLTVDLVTSTGVRITEEAEFLVRVMRDIS